VDQPEFLVESGIELHRQMIKQMKGVPGVNQERYADGMNIRHCALSLVGEPIIYPYINKFVDLLHDRHISTFMVTNAQFPEKVAELKPVTQLYLSIDAATPDSLKAVDRPLFKDFWDRHVQSIDALRVKKQRTVFRLTLVKQFNMDEIENYAKLAARGLPDFIEVKGVTYCGVSEASPLTIKNTPFHQEVVKFCIALRDEIARIVNKEDADYDLSCEHEHSLCILIANKNKFFKNDKWHTWIDYAKFDQLVKLGNEFVSEDYMEETPSWAAYGSKERGFDPVDERFKRAKKAPPTSGC
jgi:tRNA wybutosine-synthesizing protein 1